MADNNPQTPTALANAPRTPYNRFRDLVKSDNVKERFEQLLDKRAPEFLASLLSLVTADQALLECEPATIFAAAAKAAILKLPISKELGFAYIIPFKREATFVCGYKGLIQLAIRTGQYLIINAAEIYEGERVVVDRLTGTVKLNGQRTGDPVTGYVAYFKLKNGFEKFLYLSREDMAKHAAHYSKSYGNQRSAWTTNFDDMGKKTVLRLLLGKYGLLSIEMQDSDAVELPAVSEDPRLKMPAFEDLSGPVVDGAFEPEPQTQPESELDQQPETQPETNGQLEMAIPGEISTGAAPMSLADAEAVTNSAGVRYGEIPTEKLAHMANTLAKVPSPTPAQEHKLLAIQVVIAARNLKTNGAPS